MAGCRRKSHGLGTPGGAKEPSRKAKGLAVGAREPRRWSKKPRWRSPAAPGARQEALRLGPGSPGIGAPYKAVLATVVPAPDRAAVPWGQGASLDRTSCPDSGRGTSLCYLRPAPRTRRPRATLWAWLRSTRRYRQKEPMPRCLHPFLRRRATHQRRRMLSCRDGHDRSDDPNAPRRRGGPEASEQRPWVAAVASAYRDVRPSGHDTPGPARLPPSRRCPATHATARHPAEPRLFPQARTGAAPGRTGAAPSHGGANGRRIKPTAGPHSPRCRRSGTPHASTPASIRSYRGHAS